MKKNIILHLSLGVLLLFNACKKDDSSPLETPIKGTISLNSSYTTSAIIGKLSSVTGVDSVIISRARFVIKDLKFKSATEDSLNFKTAAFVLDLNLNGTEQNIAISEAPYGSYKRIEFDVHRIEAKTITGRTDTAQFADFLKDEKYSVIISGTVRLNGKDSAFTYRSKIDAKQKIDINPPLTISKDTANVNTTLRISSANWFRNKSGVFVDPNDKNNEGIIDENIKISIKLKR